MYRYVDLRTFECRQCPPGTRGRSEETSCKKCTQEVVTRNGRQECTCKLGWGYLSTDKTKCEPCPKGEYRFSLDYDYCSNFQPGTYSDETGSLECKECPKGRGEFRNYAQTKCPPACPANSSHTEGLVGCKCNSGYKNIGSSSKPTCRKCPDGLKVDENGRKCVCTGYAELRGGVRRKCAPGTKSNFDGRCIPCKVNTVAPLWGSNYCEDCSRGSLSLREGGTKCFRCDNGTFVTKDGKCGKCPVGHRVRNGECVKCVESVSLGGSVGYCKLCRGNTVPNAALSSCVDKDVN